MKNFSKQKTELNIRGCSLILISPSKTRFVRLWEILIGFLKHCKYTLTRNLKLQFYFCYTKTLIQYVILVYDSIWQKSIRTYFTLAKEDFADIK